MLMLSKESIVRKKVILCLKDIATVAETVEDLQMCLELADDIYMNGKDFKSNLFYFLPCLVKNKHCNVYIFNSSLGIIRFRRICK